MYHIWLNAMSDAVLLDLLSGLRKLEAMQTDENMDRWCLCSGTGISSHIAAAAASVIYERFGITLNFCTKVYCEQASPKQQFLQKQHDPEILTHQLQELKETCVRNRATRRPCTHPHEDAIILPFCWMIDMGVPCRKQNTTIY